MRRLPFTVILLVATLAPLEAASAQDGSRRGGLPESTLERMAREETAPQTITTSRPGFFATFNESNELRGVQQVEDGHWVAAGIDAFGTGATNWARDPGTTTMAGDLRWAIEHYDGEVSYRDPQRHLSADFWSRTGSAEFNRAKPDGDFAGGAAAARATGAWLRDKAANGGTTQRELMLEAIRQNRGNVTLAMGTLAEVLHHDRPLADHVEGLGDPERKDYYRFAGAFVGLQSNPVTKVSGWVGSHINILGNAPLFLVGTLVIERSFGEAWRQFAPRARPAANLAKIREFNIGAAAAAAALGAGRETPATTVQTNAPRAPASGFARSLGEAFDD